MTSLKLTIYNTVKALPDKCGKLLQCDMSIDIEKLRLCAGGYWATSAPMWRPSWRGGGAGQQWGSGAGRR